MLVAYLSHWNGFFITAHHGHEWRVKLTTQASIAETSRGSKYMHFQNPQTRSAKTQLIDIVDGKNENTVPQT